MTGSTKVESVFLVLFAVHLCYYITIWGLFFWGDYWEMQQDWTAYVDSLERDGEVDYEEAKNWDNPCTPQTFKEWINE